MYRARNSRGVTWSCARELDDGTSSRARTLISSGTTSIPAARDANAPRIEGRW